MIKVTVPGTGMAASGSCWKASTPTGAAGGPGGGLPGRAEGANLVRAALALRPGTGTIPTNHLMAKPRFDGGSAVRPTGPPGARPG
ncbi:MAG: hypothetical protein ACRD0J_06325 [Acidimicrobiales bacterium]